MGLDITKVRADFPILSRKVNDHDLIYFDNAATSQKPRVMIEALSDYYLNKNANIHRGVHTLSFEATEEYEETRRLLAKMYNADPKGIIFTKNDTESLNLIIQTLGAEILSEGEIEQNIVITESEHHSNIVPWQIIKDRTKPFEIKYLDFDDNGFLRIENLANLIDENTKFFSFTWSSNTFGVINNAKKLIQEVKRLNPETIIIVDAAQFVPHDIFDFNDLGADFITFSAHKMCGPTGLGVLIGQIHLLNRIKPFLGGGDMIREVAKEGSTFNDLPYKFEAGTPNIADVIAFQASLEYLINLGFENIKEYEIDLANYLMSKMESLEFIDIYGVKSVKDCNSSKLPLVSFNVKNIHAHDIGSILDKDGIAVRTGHHCTQLIMKKLGIPASVRASLYFYNTKEEIDIFIKSLKKAKEIFK